MMQAQDFGPDDLETIRNMKEAGHSDKHIGRALGCSAPVIGQARRLNGIGGLRDAAPEPPTAGVLMADEEIARLYAGRRYEGAPVRRETRFMATPRRGTGASSVTMFEGVE